MLLPSEWPCLRSCRGRGTSPPCTPPWRRRSRWLPAPASWRRSAASNSVAANGRQTKVTADAQRKRETAQMQKSPVWCLLIGYIQFGLNQSANITPAFMKITGNRNKNSQVWNKDKTLRITMILLKRLLCLVMFWGQITSESFSPLSPFHFFSFSSF